MNLLEKLRCTLFARLALLWLIPVAHPCGAVTLNASDYGLIADGRADDGPAILKLLDAAKTSEKPVTLVFPPNKVIFAATARKGYLFSLREYRDIAIDGNGCTFLLDPGIRMADMHFARNVMLKNCNVDFTKSMFAETTVRAVDPARSFVDVSLSDAADASDLGGPTKQEGEQWFGGFVWCENGTHPKAARHFAVKSVEKRENGLMSVHYGEGTFGKSIADTIIPGKTAFSVPRAGVAHRHGPGALFEIHDATDVTLERVHVWGAPWFSFSIYRCEGHCRFIDVDVIPKPNSQRLMSGCRDAFHVTGNRAKLLFEHCDTGGIGDDDYNFCVLSSSIRKVLSPNQIIIRQKFPIQYNPMRVGETLQVMNAENIVLGSAKIASYNETPPKNGSAIVAGGSCPEVTLLLDRPVSGLTPGLTVWAKEAANPDTTMRHCRATFSIRMQTSLKIEDCRFTCYNVSYGMSPRQDNVEGPGPESMWIKNTEFHTGRGSGYVAQCGGIGPLEQTRIQNIHIEGCTFHAPLRIARARAITLLNNQFHGDVSMGEHQSLDMRGNKKDGRPFSLPQQQGK